MTRTHEKVSPSPEGKPAALPAEPHAEPTRQTAAKTVGEILKLIGGRWKLLILFELFGGKVLRFSELERALPAVSQKMLAQQLRQMETDGMVVRVVYAEVPPRVDYRLSDWGQSLCPTLDSLLKWNAGREDITR